MDETATRLKKIDPKLYEVGWEQVPQSEILTEQRAYHKPIFLLCFIFHTSSFCFDSARGISVIFA